MRSNSPTTSESGEVPERIWLATELIRTFGTEWFNPPEHIQHLFVEYVRAGSQPQSEMLRQAANEIREMLEKRRAGIAEPSEYAEGIFEGYREIAEWLDRKSAFASSAPKESTNPADYEDYPDEELAEASVYGLSPLSSAPVSELGCDCRQVALDVAKAYVARTLAPENELVHERNDYWQRAKGAEMVAERLTAAALLSPQVHNPSFENCEHVNCSDHPPSPEGAQVAERITEKLDRYLDCESIAMATCADGADLQNEYERNKVLIALQAAKEKK